MKSRNTVIALVAGISTLTAQGAPAPEVKPFELKKRSSFTVRAEARAPFWPIGWVKKANESAPQQVASTPVAPKVTVDPSQFKISSILLGSPSLAVINGRAYGEGDILRLPRSAAAQPVRVRVQQITDGQVTLVYDQQIFTLSFRRPELAQRKPEQELLLEDR